MHPNRLPRRPGPKPGKRPPIAATSDVCRRCKRPIARQLKSEALCCQCRYRTDGLDDALAED